jgi:Capsule assembly protein Wzi
MPRLAARLSGRAQLLPPESLPMSSPESNRRPSSLALLACSLLLAVGAAGARAQAMLMPGDVRLRSDLELLADEHVIDLPLMTWPIPLDAVTVALDGVPEPSGSDPALLAAFYRVQGLIAERQSERSLDAQASASAHPERLRTFEDTPRTSTGASLGASMVENHWDGSLIVGLAGAPQDGQVLRFDGSYLQGVLGNWLVGAYAVDQWWGPGWDGSLILGNAARPVPGVGIRRRAMTPFQSRWLHWIGSWTANFGVAELGNDRTDFKHPLLVTERVAIKPTRWLEFAVSRVWIFCGAGQPCGLHTWSDFILGQQNHANAAGTPINPGLQKAGFDLRLNSPWHQIPAAAYAQLIGADEVGGFPDNYFAIFGIEGWHALANGALLRAHLEWHNTTCQFYARVPHWNCAYDDPQYFYGYRYRGYPLGDSLDQDSEVLSLRADLLQSNGQDWSVMARAGALGRSPFGEAFDAATSTREQIKELLFGWRSDYRGHDLAINLGALHVSQPAQGTSDNPLELSVSWKHRL